MIKPVNFELRKTRDFGELITDTFTFVKICWKPLLMAFASICGFFVLGSIVTDCMYKFKMAEVMQNPQSGGVAGRLYGMEYFLFLLFSFIQYLFVSLTTLCFVSLYHEKGQVAPTVAEVWVYLKFYLIRFFFATLVLAFFQILGFILCVIPGIYLLPITSLILAVLVLDNADLGYSYNRAFFLIKDNWWPIFGAVFVMTIIVYMGIGFTSLPATILTMLRLFTGSFNPVSAVLTVFFSILQHIGTVALMLPWILISLVYFSLSEKKEGVGLAGKIDGFGLGSPVKIVPDEEY